jgi:G3E family GTPase
VLFADHCDVDSGYLLEGEFSGLLAQRAAGGRGDDHHHDHDHGHDHEHGQDHDHGSGHHPVGEHRHPHAPAESFVLDASGGARRGALEGFFRALPDNVWRAKGFMRIDGQPSLVQYTMGQLEITPAEPPPAHNLVFIGRDMDRSAISAGLQRAQG